MLNCLFAMLWIRPVDITFRPEGGYLFFSQLFDSHSNNWFNGIANFHNAISRSRLNSKAVNTFTIPHKIRILDDHPCGSC